MNIKLDDIFKLSSGKYIALERGNYKGDIYLFAGKLSNNEVPLNKFVVFRETNQGLIEEKDQEKLKVILNFFCEKLNDKIELVNETYKREA